jgi:hypothetical protein
MNRLLSESFGENEDLFFLAPYFFISYSFGFSVTPRFFEWSLDSTFYCFCQVVECLTLHDLSRHSGEI